MTTKTLRVRLRDRSPEAPPSVQNYEQLESGAQAVNCFIGLKLSEVSPGRFGRVPTGETVELPFRAEYVKALHDGDLVAADAETAKAAGLSFASDEPPPARTRATTSTSDNKRGDS